MSRSPQLGGLTEDLADILAKGPQVASQVAAITRKIWPYLGTIRTVVDDPALPAVIQRVQVIQTLPPLNLPSFTAPSPTPAIPEPGIGLKNVVPALDAYIYARRNPWVPFAVLGGIIFVIGGLGYRLGQRKAARK